MNSTTATPAPAKPTPPSSPPAAKSAPLIPIKPPRMTLAAITAGRKKKPYREFIHGPDGVGKSSFCADAPKPIFIGTEDGTEHLDIARFPTPLVWPDVLEAIRTLTNETHDFKTLVIDSVDWAEPLLWQQVCARAGVGSIEEVAGGYGKGYTAAIDDWRVLLAALERLQEAKQMHVLLIGHSLIKTFKNPEGDDFDRYIIKLNEKAAGLIREWCSGVYFANYETFAVKDKAKRVRGVSTGARLLYTNRTAAYDAKQHKGLPDSLPLSWAEFEKAVALGEPSDPVALVSEIERKAKQLGGELEKTTLDSLGRNKGDAQKLSQLNSWVNAKVAEKAEKES